MIIWGCIWGFFVSASLAQPVNTPKTGTLFQKTASILETIQTMQDSTLTGDIPIEVVSSIEMYPAKARFVLSHVLPEGLPEEGRLLKKLGAIPQEYNYEQGMVELYLEPLEAYYHYQQGVLYVPNWKTPIEQEFAISRSAGVAVQDQVIQLENYLKPSTTPNADLGLARSAVINGKAMGFAISYQMGGEGRTFVDIPSVFNTAREMLLEPRLETLEFQNAPPFVQEVYLFPYTYGTVFLSHIANRIGWENLDIVYVEPPASTEHILHPNTYLDLTNLAYRDEPDSIFIPNLTADLLRSWSLVHSMVMGEFRTFLLLNQYDRAKARAAAEGWEGDRVMLYQNPYNDELLIYLSKWESHLDTRQFYYAYRNVIEAKYPDAELVESTATSLTWQKEGLYIYLMRYKFYVLILEGVPENLLKPVSSEVMPVKFR